MMRSLSKIIIVVLVFLLFLSAFASYYRFFVINDYTIVAQSECDPSIESCFIWECNPEVEGECTGNSEDDIWYFKIIQMNGKNVQNCHGEDCSCLNVPDCFEILCSEETRKTYNIDSCSNINEFSL